MALYCSSFLLSACQSTNAPTVGRMCSVHQHHMIDVITFVELWQPVSPGELISLHKLRCVQVHNIWNEHFWWLSTWVFDLSTVVLNGKCSEILAIIRFFSNTDESPHKQKKKKTCVAYSPAVPKRIQAKSALLGENMEFFRSLQAVH